MDKESNKKCNCGEKNGMCCRNCSKVKIVFCLKHGNNHLKIGNGCLPTIYSRVKENPFKESWLVQVTIQRMIDTDRNIQEAYDNSNVIIAYNNFNGQEIERIRP